MGLQLVIKPVSFSGTVRIAGQAMDMQEQPTTDELFDMVTKGSRIPLDEIRKHPEGRIYPDPPVFVAPKDDGWEGRFDFSNAQMMNDLGEIARTIVADGAPAPPRPGRPGANDARDEAARPFRLVSRRQMNVLNSVGQELSSQNRGLTTNPAYLHPEDLSTLDLAEGDLVEIRSEHATILGVVGVDPNLRRGLVSMTHSWGDGPERDHEVREIGGNTGRLSAVDTHYERYTGLPRMSNIPVTLARASI
jgi:anaerobic selenocysteine-containing dehydrogenase